MQCLLLQLSMVLAVATTTVLAHLNYNYPTGYNGLKDTNNHKPSSSSNSIFAPLLQQEHQKPQQLYNYNRNHNNNNFNNNHNDNKNYISRSISYNQNSNVDHNNDHKNNVNHKYLPPSVINNNYLPPSVSSHNYLPPAVNNNKYLPPSQPHATPHPIISKQFYFISAPEDEDSEPKRKHFVLGRPTRNYRVVFIKAPIPDNDNLKYTAEFAPQEEKTVIYVLSKKDNELQIQDIATQKPPEATKPEVFFIKYKTKDEATAAQKEIQDQYDHLGGTNEFHDIGVAPVTSVVGSLETARANGPFNIGYNYQKPEVANANANAINNFLLPPEVKNQ